MSVNDQKASHLHEQALAFMAKGNYPEAISKLEEAIFVDPLYAHAYNNRANCLHALGNHFDAVLNYDKAIGIEPNGAEFWNNRGAALMDLGRIEDAVSSYNTALGIRPNFGVVLRNLGNAMRVLGETPKARDYYERAVACSPNDPDTHLAYSLALLELGDYENGWQEYEWRLKTSQLPNRGLPYPQWRGEQGNVLIYGEQGFGDVLQFCRYAALVKEKCGGKVYLEVRQPLARLMRSVPGVDEVISFGEKIPADLTHCISVMSLPMVMGTTLETIPNKVPYFSVSPERVDAWKKDLELLPPGMKVGICWAGMSRPSQPMAALIDQRRSTTLKSFAPLAEVPGVSWVSLQLGPPLEQIKEPPHGMTILDVSEQLDDFYDTAALVKNLDLVITVDTAVCHVAGAMGVPTWMLSRFDGCWRWLGDRSDSPWYPTLKQYRQPKSGDWYTVMKQAAEDLFKLRQSWSCPTVELRSNISTPINLEGLPEEYMNPGELDTIITLLRGAKPKSMVEIGVNSGRTAKAILDNVPGIEQYVGIDVLPGYPFEKEIQANEVPELPGELVKDDDRFQLRVSKHGSFDYTENDFEPVDAVFIDGDHGRKAVLHDTDLATKIVKPGGLIIWHDYHDMPVVDVKPTLDELKRSGRNIVHVKDTWLAFEKR